MYGSQHEGKDTSGHLGAGLIPAADTKSASVPFHSVYGNEYSHKDTQSNIIFGTDGVIPASGYAQREGFAAAYGNEHGKQRNKQF